MSNNWNHKDWTKSEQIFIQYHEPPGDTAKFQASNLKLIATFHPKQFEDGEKYGTWGTEPYWQKIIFIDYEDKDVQEITRFARLKRKDMPGHEAQVYNVEIDCIKRLRLDKLENISIHWRQFKTAEDFCLGIQSLCKKLDINYYADPVRELWQSWNKENNLFSHSQL